MANDSITIGITAYNAADTISAALGSALAQTVPVAQIIVVDDASTDETAARVKALADEVPLIELIRHEQNKGVAAARNTILNHARGAFVAFFDDDDISAPDRVLRQRDHILAYEASHAHGAPVICHTARTQIYPDGTHRVEPAMGGVPGPAPRGREVLRFTLLGEPLREGAFGSCATCSQMARLDTYLALGGFDPAFRRCEDSDLALRLAKVGGHFTGLADPLVTQQMTGTSDKALDTLERYSLRLLDKHRDAFDTAAQYQFTKAWMRLKFRWMASTPTSFLVGLLPLLMRHPVQTTRRLTAAFPNLMANRAFARFARGTPHADTTSR
jgi:glycosyltransferase involved in cell wall biosynthesis